jgi:hypothetical protein
MLGPRRTVRKIIVTQEIEWHITCDPQTFGKCREDPKFAYIVTLARTVNALNFVNSVMVDTQGRDDPAAQRNRLNSYLFGSAIMYEALKLVRTMNKVFLDDNEFQNGLRSLLKDPTAQQIERDHLNPARHQAVFHFIPETFAEAIGKTSGIGSAFVSSRGSRRGNVSYVYSDIVAAEILVGLSSNTEEFYSALGDAMAKTRDLVIKFTNSAESLIAHHLKAWGFQKEDSR